MRSGNWPLILRESLLEIIRINAGFTHLIVDSRSVSVESQRVILDLRSINGMNSKLPVLSILRSFRDLLMEGIELTWRQLQPVWWRWSFGNVRLIDPPPA